MPYLIDNDTNSKGHVIVIPAMLSCTLLFNSNMVNIRAGARIGPQPDQFELFFFKRFEFELVWPFQFQNWSGNSNYQFGLINLTTLRRLIGKAAVRTFVLLLHML